MLSKLKQKFVKTYKSVKSRLPGKPTSQKLTVFEKKEKVSCIVSDKGIDTSGNLKETLCTTYLVRHIDINMYNELELSLTLKTKYCVLQEVHLFERFL